jgi:hypothetical protein
MLKIKVLKEQTPQQPQQAAPQQAAPQQAAPQQAAPQQAAPKAEATQSPEQMAQAAYSLLEKMVNEKIVPTITKTIQDAMKGQQAPKQPAPAAPAQKSAQPAPAAAPAKTAPPKV